MSGFKPSTAAKLEPLSIADRVGEYTQTAGPRQSPLGTSNSMYKAIAESTLAPFLAENIRKDQERRDYVILPGGQQIRRGQKVPAVAPFPDEKEVFGHLSGISPFYSDPHGPRK